MDRAGELREIMENTIKEWMDKNLEERVKAALNRNEEGESNIGGGSSVGTNGGKGDLDENKMFRANNIAKRARV